MARTRHTPTDYYTEWLGIEPGPRPPDHYTLLGLPRTAADPEAIRAAARRRMDQVRPRCLKYPETGTRLLNEIAAAQVCLLDPEAKADYDRSLASRICPHCGRRNPAEAQFCYHDGVYLPSPAAAQTRADDEDSLPDWWPELEDVSIPLPSPPAMPPPVPAASQPAMPPPVPPPSPPAMPPPVPGELPDGAGVCDPPPLPIPAVLAERAAPGSAPGAGGPDAGAQPPSLPAPTAAPAPAPRPARSRSHKDRSGTWAVALIAAAVPVAFYSAIQGRLPDQRPVFVKTTPPGADVLVDGQLVGNSPLRVVAGESSVVRAELRGYEPASWKRIRGDKAEEAVLRLKPLPAVFVLEVSPEAAIVSVAPQGAAVSGRGRTRRVEFPEPSGTQSYAVVVSHPGRGAKQQSVTPQPGETQALSFRLESLAIEPARRGAAKLNEGKYEQAEADLSEAVTADPSYAPALLDRAEVRLRKGNADGAIADGEAAIANGLQEAAVFAVLAAAHWQKHQPEQARRAAETALEKEPGCSRAHAVLGALHLEQGEHQQAVRECSLALEGDGKNAEVWLTRGVAHLRLKKWDEAIEDLRRAIALGKNTAYAPLGEAHRLKGYLREAIRDCDQALERDPGLVAAHATRAEARAALGGDLDAVVADCRKWAGLDRAAARPHVLWGEACWKKGETKEAIACCTEAIERDAKNARAYAIRAEARTALKADYDKVVEDCDKWLELAPGTTRAFALRGAAYLHVNQGTAAIADATQALEKDSRSVLALATRAAARFAQQENPLALRDCTAWIGLADRDPDAYLLRTQIHLAMDWAPGAIADARKAVELAPDRVQAHLLLSKAHALNADLEKAIRSCERARDLDPKSCPIRRTLAGLYERGGKYRKALGELHRANKLEPANAEVLNDLAWMLAACADPALRDSDKALEYAKQAYKTDEENLRYQSTLAAAYAANMEFLHAILHQQRVLKAATTEEERAEAERRLELYKKDKSYVAP